MVQPSDLLKVNSTSQLGLKDPTSDIGAVLYQVTYSEGSINSVLSFSNAPHTQFGVLGNKIPNYTAAPMEFDPTAMKWVIKVQSPTTP